MSPGSVRLLVIETRRSKIVSRATGRYAATSFDQLLVCPRSSFVSVVQFFFCPLRLIPVFDRLALLDRPRFSRFPKQVMKKVITHHLKTLSVYSAIQSMFFILFRCSRLILTTSCHFQAPHVIMLRY